MSKEIWKDIKEYEGLYQVSNLGRVKSLPKIQGRTLNKEIILKPRKKNGYYQRALSKNKISKRFLVSRLVAIAFIPNPKNKQTVNHIDGNKLNNNIKNLEWNTRSENTLHAFRIGLHSIPNGEKNNQHKLNEKQVRFIRKRIFTIPELSKIFNVSRGCIEKIIYRGSWKHIK